jgi:hypothetical protein
MGVGTHVLSIWAAAFLGPGPILRVTAGPNGPAVFFGALLLAGGVQLFESLFSSEITPK